MRHDRWGISILKRSIFAPCKKTGNIWYNIITFVAHIYLLYLHHLYTYYIMSHTHMYFEIIFYFYGKLYIIISASCFKKITIFPKTKCWGKHNTAKELLSMKNGVKWNKYLYIKEINRTLRISFMGPSFFGKFCEWRHWLLFQTIFSSMFVKWKTLNDKR